MDIKYCANCGDRINQRGDICPKCGARQSGSYKYQKGHPHKNPVIAAVLSAFWVGMGQIYNGEIAKGIFLMIFYVISIVLISLVIGLIIAPVLWIYGIYNAYNTAKKINNREKLDENGEILKKTNNEDNKKDIKAIEPKIIDGNKKFNPNGPKSKNDLLNRAFEHQYLKRDLMLSEKLNENDEISKKKK